MTSFKTSDHKAGPPTQISFSGWTGGEGTQMLLLNAPTVVASQWLFIRF